MKDFIRQRLNEHLNLQETEFRFNDGRLNKNGANTIYMNGEAIVDFGIGEIGTVNVNGQDIPNAIYLKGGYNAAAQKRGYGTLGLRAIFNKLPKIQNLILQCYDTACPFWKKMGGQEITTKELPGGTLRTLVVTRDAFNAAQGL